MKLKIHILPIVLSGFFLFCDQTLKYIARTNPEATHYIWKPWIGWEYFKNMGIAFGIPLPQTITTLLTPIIIILIVAWWSQKKEKKIFFYTGTLLVICGAISNFIDRILFSSTIDYIRVFTSVFNIADVMILLGAGLLFFGEVYKKNKI